LRRARAGIGKSRILAALRERIGDERLPCCAISAHRITSTTPSIELPAYLALRRFHQRRAGRGAADKLETMIARAGLDIGEIAPYLASLLSIRRGPLFPRPKWPRAR